MSVRFCESCGAELVNGEVKYYDAFDGQSVYEKVCPKKQKLVWWKRIFHEEMSGW